MHEYGSECLFSAYSVCINFHDMSELPEEVQFNWLCCPVLTCTLMGNRHSLCQVPQKSRKKVSWFFHDFSRPKSKFPEKNPKKQKRKKTIFVFAAHVSICKINYRHTQTHTHTDTDMIWSRPTSYSTDFTSNWTDSRSQNYNLIKTGNRFSY